MERSNFFNDQHVVSNDLNTIESTKIDAIERRTLALVASGSVIGHLGDTSLAPAYISYLTQITIEAGSALDTNGELITLAAVSYTHLTLPTTR
jgi:hypothetical protein